MDEFLTARIRPWLKLQLFWCSKKSGCYLGGQQGRLIPTQEKKRILALIDEACRSGASLKKACSIIGINSRTIQRWRNPEKLEDRRKESSRTPDNKLSQMERQKILETINSPEYRNLSSHQIVADLADQETYLASEATMLATLQQLGVMPSFSRPSVSNDNTLFRNLV